MLPGWRAAVGQAGCCLQASDRAGGSQASATVSAMGVQAHQGWLQAALLATER